MPKKQSGAQVGATIRSLREHLALSQEDLAHQIGMSTANVGKIERGMVDPNTSTLYRIAAALNVEITELFGNPASVNEPEQKRFVDREEFDEVVNRLWSNIQRLRKELDIRTKIEDKPGRRPK